MKKRFCWMFCLALGAAAVMGADAGGFKMQAGPAQITLTADGLTVARPGGEATGLQTNLEKSEAFPIGCTEEEIEAALHIFPAKRGVFPCTYLGLSLHHSRLKIVHF